ARDLPLFDAPLEIRRRMAEVQEVARLIRDGDRPRIPRLEPVSGALERARREAVLEADLLQAVYRLVKTGNDLRQFFRTRQKDAPLCWQVVMGIAQLDHLERSLEGVFDENGELADNASPDLAGLRRRVRKLHESMRAEIDARVNDPDVVPHLQDDYYTLREGRYVLPIKVGARGRVKGIVHDTSGSGQTVFVEPADLVDLNNRLRMSEFDVRDEELRILRRLSEQVGEHADDIERSVDRIIYVDLLRACA